MTRGEAWIARDSLLTECDDKISWMKSALSRAPAQSSIVSKSLVFAARLLSTQLSNLRARGFHKIQVQRSARAIKVLSSSNEKLRPPWTIIASRAEHPRS